MTALATWFRGRSLRERRLILVMLALAALLLAWLLIVRPLGDALADARARHNAALIALAEARSRAQAIGAMEKRRALPPDEPLEALVTRSASEAGFQLTKIQSDGGGVSVAMASARPQALFGWVGELETGRGLVVETLTARSNSDRTLSVELTLRARGS